MHIAQFTNVYRPTVNGIVRSVSVFRDALTDLGHNVFIFAQDAGDFVEVEPFVFRYPAIKLRLLKMSDYPATIPISPFVDWVIPSLKLDVLHAHHPFLIGQVASVKASELNRPLVFTFHTQYMNYIHYLPLAPETVQDLVKGGLEVWLSEFMQGCHHIIVPTESMRQVVEDTFGITKQITVLPTGIDVQPYLAADRMKIRLERGWGNDKVLISAGRIAKEKNWYTLLNAGRIAMQKHPELRIVILGDGPEMDHMKRFVDELGIAHRVELPGRVPFEQIPSFFKAADIFGFASVTETQGLVTMEALAAGLPVVAVDATGTRDAVDHDVEGLLAPNDEKALAQMLLRMLDNEADFQRYKSAAAQRAMAFDIRAQAKVLEAIYESAIDDNKAKRMVQVEKHRKFLEIVNQALPLKIPGVSKPEVS